MHTYQYLNHASHIHIFIGYLCLIFCIAFLGIGAMCAAMYYEIFDPNSSEE